MEYMKHLTLKKRQTRTKVKRSKNNMKRTKSYRKRRVTKHGMKGVMKGG